MFYLTLYYDARKHKIKILSYWYASMYSTIPVAVQSDASVCGRSPPGIAGFESPLEHGCLSLVIIVYCQTEALRRADHSSQGSPTGCGVSECVLELLRMRRPRSGRVCMVLGRGKSLDPVRIRTPNLPVRR